MTELILAVLVGLLIFQQVYYTMVVNRLVNKIMSRNYAEYAQVNKPVQKPETGNIALKFDDFSDDQASDVNKLLGITT